MFAMKTIAILFACVFVFAFTVLAQDQSPTNQQALREETGQALQGKILALAIPYTADTLQFDAQGKLVGTSLAGAWTMYSALQVAKVSVRDSSVEMDAERVLLISPSNKGVTTSPTLSGRKLHISLALTPPADETKIRTAVERVFSGENLQQRFESYWKPAVDMEKSCKAILKEHPDGVVGTLASNPVYGCVKTKVVAKPKGISTPAPGTEKKAGNDREKKDPPEGLASMRVVIDESGSPTIIKAQSISNGDYGLAALNAVSHWKYSPAVKDGKPVPYMMDIKLGNATSADNDRD
jgi:TonB-like protein